MKIEIDCMTQEDLIRALGDRHHIQSRDNAVEISGYMTGHTINPIAYCASITHAEVLAQALREYIQRRAKQ
jgi:hypothetical protein